MSSCTFIPPIPVLTYITNGIDISQTDKSISIADQEAFYDEVMYSQSSKSLVNRDDQEAFYEEIIRIEQVPLKYNEHHTPRELFAMKRRKERQHEKLVNDTILQKKNRQSRVSISRLLHNSRLQGIIDYVRLQHRSLKMHKKKKKSNRQQQMKMASLCRGSTVDLEMEEEDNMFLHDTSDSLIFGYY